MKDSLVVQVVCFETGWIGPVQSILLGFYRRVPTVGMNVITSDRAYCLFPRMTFVGRRVCSLGHNSTPQEKEAIAKYERLGWKLVNWKSEFEVLRLQERRRVGDSKTWVIALDASESAASEVEDIRFAARQYSVVLLSKLHRHPDGR